MNIFRRRRQETLVAMAGRHSQASEVLHRLLKNKLAIIGAIIVLMIVFTAIFADVLAPYDYAKQNPTEKFMFPCVQHPLGTDNYGRDLLSRIIYGSRVSILLSLMAVCISVVVGGILGATAGYFGGLYESIVMRLMDIIMAIPGFLLAVSVSAALGNGVIQTSLAIAISGIPSCARLVRASVLTVREQEYVEAARALGAKDHTIIFTQIVPNILAPLIVDMTLKIGTNILMISSLSFIGLGVVEPTPEWGAIMTKGRAYIRDFYPIVTFPGIAIMLTLFGFNLLGDGLRDAMDPRLKQ